MVHISKESELVMGLKNGDPSVIKRIYKDNFGKIKAMVVNFNNMDLDAEDVFQDGLTIALLRLIIRGLHIFSKKPSDDVLNSA